MTKLVIVESPAKVKTIRKYLPSDFKVDSCVGHVRDLPKNRKQAPKAVQDEEWADLGVDVDNDFQPVYVTIRGKGKVLKRLKKELDDAEELYLATDEDREGESISWHLVEALDPDIPVKRMVFNEITKDAVEHALENPRDIDMNLVEAQETRRILDRLYGYTLSPLLWRKIGSGLSAGRVQSPAVQVLVNRERERRRFTPAEYWDLSALLAKAGATDAPTFESWLFEVDGQRVATGSDFDRDTGELSEDAGDVVVLEEDDAQELADRLEEATWRVGSVEERQRQASPPGPFRTSTLQQDANSRLNMSPGETMRVAQDLYEDGHITYMRTDSTHLSEEALEGAKKAIAAEYGQDLLSRHPRTYEEDQAEGAQEAHEAIRPAGGTFTAPDDTGLSGRHKQLYDLIYRRTLASQMPNERYTSTTVLVEAAEAVFKATGKHVDAPGFRLAWPTQSTDEELPKLEVDDPIDLRELGAEEHETKPPSRYTEASLVRELEELGIGRPSTYADIISKLYDRDYAVKQGRSLVPTLIAFAVVGFLEKQFPKLVDAGFTAQMEKRLDEIAAGRADSLPYLEEFFLGDEGLKAQVDRKQDEIEGTEARVIVFEDLPYRVKVGRYGPYVEADRDGEVVRANLPDDITPDQIDEDLIERLIRQRAEGPESLGTDPETGMDIYLKTGRYGPYVQRGTNDEVDGKPDRASLPETLPMDDATLEDALYLLSLPTPIGEHPDGGTVLAGIGRYGPYVCLDPEGGGDRVYANVDSYEELQEIEVDEAVERIDAKRKRQRKGTIREMGKHPETEQTIELRGGRYGPYFKHGDTNKSLPDELDIDDATLEDAVFLVSLPQELGEHPSGGTLLKDLGRYGPYVALEQDGDREYLSLGDYEDLKAVDQADAEWLFSLPRELGPHPEEGTIELRVDRDGPHLAVVQDGDTVKVIRGPSVRELREMEIDDALSLL